MDIMPAIQKDRLGIREHCLRADDIISYLGIP